MADRLVVTEKNFGHIISFVYEKQLLELVWSLVVCLQDNFRFKKIEDIIHIYKKTRDELFQSAVYAEAGSLAYGFGAEEKWSDLVDSRQIRITFFSETVKKYRQRSVYFPFLDIAFWVVKPRSVKKRGRYRKYAFSSSTMIKTR